MPKVSRIPLRADCPLHVASLYTARSMDGFLTTIRLSRCVMRPLDPWLQLPSSAFLWSALDRLSRCRPIRNVSGSPQDHVDIL